MYIYPFSYILLHVVFVIMVYRGAGHRFCCPCMTAGDSDYSNSTTDNRLRDLPDSGSYFNPPDQNNVYQEVRTQASFKADPLLVVYSMTQLQYLTLSAI